MKHLPNAVFSGPTLDYLSSFLEEKSVSVHVYPFLYASNKKPDEMYLPGIQPQRI
jgi:hypothetical protein